MGPHDRRVIIGGGQAAAAAVETLRSEGFPGPVSVVCAEPYLPYLRPPLSKEYLRGQAARESVFIHDADWYVEQGVDVQLGVDAVSIDPVQQSVLLSDGSRLTYGAALMATGASPRRLMVAGGDLAGIHYLRRLDDADRISAALAGVERVVVVGAGWIGLEVAAAAREAGVNVTIVEPESVPLLHVLGPQVGSHFADLHEAHGVTLLTHAYVAEFVGVGGVVTGVRLADDRVLKADAVIVGIGAQPNVGVASASRLSVADGIVVDEHLQTSQPGVFAAGDVASAFNRRLGRHLRVEHWENAKRQGAVAALGMMGRVAVYDRLPFFYSDQYDVGLEYTGYAAPGSYDSVVIRGDVDDRRYAAFWVAAGRVLAGMTVNIWDIRPQIEALIESGSPVDPEMLADAATPLVPVVN
jgi:3-phenylpropionate/trans-cinnamate dioxygenase ferredoxin reductase component